METIKPTIFDVGYDRNLIRNFLLVKENSVISQDKINSLVSPEMISSGDITGNLIVVAGYLQSSNYLAGLQGWRFNSAGNIDANDGYFRGTIVATVGNIGGWVIDTYGLFYDGSGAPSIRTAENVGAGADGVVIDKDGVRCYDAVLGCVVNLPADGTPPSFASGVINNTIFEVDTNAIIRTSDMVGDGSANSAGVLQNNGGIYLCGANQTLDNANVKFLINGNAYFKGTILASEIYSTTITGADISGGVITGALFRTSESGQRTEITDSGIVLLNGEIGAAYGDEDYLYGDANRKYGTGVLAYINNTSKIIPFYVSAEQSVGDFHMVNRSSDPSGIAEVGDLCVVNGKLKICTSGGTPGTWTIVGVQTA
ncbi:MAG: hypothetical protein WC451_05025 [Patescibacteria group bacterium]